MGADIQSGCPLPFWSGSAPGRRTSGKSSSTSLRNTLGRGPANPSGSVSSGQKDKHEQIHGDRRERIPGKRETACPACCPAYPTVSEGIQLLFAGGDIRGECPFSFAAGRMRITAPGRGTGSEVPQVQFLWESSSGVFVQGSGSVPATEPGDHQKTGSRQKRKGKPEQAAGGVSGLWDTDRNIRCCRRGIRCAGHAGLCWRWRGIG